MQTLFFKKNNLEKKNNRLVNSFYINIILITLLSLNIIPFISTEIILSIIVFLFAIEGIIVKKVKDNEEMINDIKKEINYLKIQDKKEIKVNDNNLNILKNNNLFIKNKKIKVKKKCL